MILLQMYAGLKILKEFFTALPVLYKLVQVVHSAIEQEKTDRKVKDDLSAIHEAFKAKDATKLDYIFRSR